MSAPPVAFTVADLAQRLGARLRGPGNVPVTGIAGIDDAKGGEVTFISDRHYAARWPACKAAAAVMREGLEVPADHRPLLAVKDVDLAMIPLLTLFAPPEDLPEVGVHASAVVHPSASLGKMVRIGAHVSVGANVALGDGVTLHPGVRLYAGVKIGAGSTLHANTAVRERCMIGCGVILHQNVSIGADGFGYRPAPDGRGLLKMPHVGTVIIEDGVEIGANSCVDRAKFGATVIGAGTKIDNQVQIAHNCRIGRCCLLAGQVGVGGSVTLGDGVILGGGVAVCDHLTIGSGARVGAMSFVIKDIPPGTSWLGHPAEDGQTALRQWASVRRLPDLIRRLSAIEPTADPLPEAVRVKRAQRQAQWNAERRQSGSKEP